MATTYFVLKPCAVRWTCMGGSPGRSISSLNEGELICVQLESNHGSDFLGWESSFRGANPGLIGTHLVPVEIKLPKGKWTLPDYRMIYDITVDPRWVAQGAWSSGICYRNYANFKGSVEVFGKWVIKPIAGKFDPNTTVGDFLVLGPLSLRREFHGAKLLEVCEEVVRTGDEIVAPMWHFKHVTEAQIERRAKKLVSSGDWSFGGKSRELELEPDELEKLVAEVPQPIHQEGRPLRYGWDVISRFELPVWTDGVKTWVKVPAVEVVYHPFDWENEQEDYMSAGVFVHGRRESWEEGSIEALVKAVTSALSDEKPHIVTVNGFPVDELWGEISAQVLYDLREQYEFCPRADLQKFFESECGDPSPSGKMKLSGEKALGFVLGCICAQAWNNSEEGVRWAVYGEQFGVMRLVEDQFGSLEEAQEYSVFGEHGLSALGHWEFRSYNQSEGAPLELTEDM